MHLAGAIVFSITQGMAISLAEGITFDLKQVVSSDKKRITLTGVVQKRRYIKIFFPADHTLDQLFLFFVSVVWVHIFCIGGKTDKSKRLRKNVRYGVERYKP